MLQLVTASDLPAFYSLKKTLDKQGIKYVVRRLEDRPFTFSEFAQLLALSEKGIDEVINRRFFLFKELRKQGEFENLTIRDLHQIIVRHPLSIKVPLLVDFEKGKFTNYTESSYLSVFLPRKTKERIFKETLAYARKILPDVPGEEDKKQCTTT